jgi:hypothetical protein
MSAKEPETVDEWTTKVLNIQGAIFERGVAHKIRKGGLWRVMETERPVAYPPAGRDLPSPRESTLDVLARFTEVRYELDLVIECKKNNPRFIDWIFFRRHEDRPSELWTHQIVWRTPEGSRPAPEYVVHEFYPQVPMADYGVETRGRYDQPTQREFTKTSAQAINDAAHQVVIATKALLVNEYGDLLVQRDRSERFAPIYQVKGLLPLIVTTANLKMAIFDPGQVDPGTGEIDHSAMQYKATPWLFYVYPVPVGLQHLPESMARPLSVESLYRQLRMPIAVVQSRDLNDFLKTVARDHWQYMST